MNGEEERFDIDEELSVLWQKAYCAVRDIVLKRGRAGIVLEGIQMSVCVDESGQVLFGAYGCDYDLAEAFDDATMYAVLRELMWYDGRPCA